MVKMFDISYKYNTCTEDKVEVGCVFTDEENKLEETELDKVVKLLISEFKNAESYYIDEYVNELDEEYIKENQEDVNLRRKEIKRMFKNFEDRNFPIYVDCLDEVETFLVRLGMLVSDCELVYNGGVGTDNYREYIIREF